MSKKSAHRDREAVCRGASPSSRGFWRSVCLIGLCLTGACYRSDYISRRDGRARVIWNGESLAPDFSSASISVACANKIREDVAKSSREPSVGTTQSDWHPVVFYHVLGPPLGDGRASDSTTGGARLLPYPVFSSRLARPTELSPALLTEGRRLLEPPQRKGAARILRYLRLFVVDTTATALTVGLTPFVLPIHTLSLLSETSMNPFVSYPFYVPDAIDHVNAYNELARQPGSDCSYRGSGKQAGGAP